MDGWLDGWIVQAGWMALTLPGFWSHPKLDVEQTTCVPPPSSPPPPPSLNHPSYTIWNPELDREVENRDEPFIDSLHSDAYPFANI